MSTMNYHREESRLAKTRSDLAPLKSTLQGCEFRLTQAEEALLPLEAAVENLSGRLNGILEAKAVAEAKLALGGLPEEELALTKPQLEGIPETQGRLEAELGAARLAAPEQAKVVAVAAAPLGDAMANPEYLRLQGIFAAQEIALANKKISAAAAKRRHERKP